MSIYDREGSLETHDKESERGVQEFHAAVGGALDEQRGAEIKHQAMFKDPFGRVRCFMAHESMEAFVDAIQPTS